MMISDATKNTISVEPASDALLLRPADCARVLGVGVRTLRTWDAAGLLPRAVRIGRIVLWSRDELRRWASAGCPARPAWERMQEAAERPQLRTIGAKGSRSP